jgi:hypothetical protein
LQGDAEAALWQLLAGPGSDVASEVATRTHEALCSVAEDDARAWAEAWRREQEVAREQRRAERRAAAAAQPAGAAVQPWGWGGPRSQQQQQQQQPGLYAPRGGGG